MTSEKSLHKITIINLKNNMYMAFLSFITFMLLFPVRLLFMKQNIENTYSISDKVTYDFQIKLMYKQLLQNVDLINTLFLIVFAFLMAAFNFKYLHNAASEDFYHSIPVKRKDLFIIKYLNGAVLVLVPFILANIAGIIMAFAITPAPYSSIPLMLYTMLRNIAGFLSVYSCIVFSMVITGRTFIGCLTAAFFMTFIPGCLSLYYSIIGTCNQHIIGENFRGSLVSNSAFSPAASIISCNGKAPSVMISLGYAIVLTLLGIFLYNRRPSESAGESYSWPVTKNIFKYMIAVPSSVLTGYLIYTLAGADSNVADRVWFIVSTLFFGFLYSLIIDIIFNQGPFRLRYGLKITFLSVITDGLILIIAIFDPFGIDNYVPKASDLRSVGFSSGYETYYQGTTTISGDSTAFAEKNQTTDVVPVLKAISGSLKNPVSNIDQEKISFSNDDEYYVDKAVKCTVCYVLKSGRKIYRIYAIDTKKHDALLDTITKDPEYNKNASIFNSNEVLPYSSALVSDWNTNIPLNKSLPLLKPDAEKLMNALKKDSESMTYSDYRKSTPLFSILMADPGYNYNEVDYDKPYVSNMFIYPEYKNTLVFLAKRGISENDKSDFSGKVSNVNYQSYTNSKASLNISNPEKIKTFFSSVKRIPDDLISERDGKNKGFAEVSYKNGSEYTRDTIQVIITDKDKLNKLLKEDKNE